MAPLTAEKVADYLPLSGKMPDISGRIINVTHQIPYQISRHDVHPPPAGAPVSKLNRNHQRRGTLRAHFRAAEWSIVQSRGHGALNAGLQRLGEDYDTLHIGWAGMDLNDDDKTKIQDLLYEKGKIVPIFLDAKQKRGHYEGYCKEILWPLLHYLVDGSDGRIEKKYWADYKAVNQTFADTVVAHYRPGDISKCGLGGIMSILLNSLSVFINDYHLLLVPKMLREKIPNAPIGLFLHSPFPSSEIFRCLTGKNISITYIFF
jgi:trehalose 6-phosphate synthase/phosphatase